MSSRWIGATDLSSKHRHRTRRSIVRNGWEDVKNRLGVIMNTWHLVLKILMFNSMWFSVMISLYKIPIDGTGPSPQKNHSYGPVWERRNRFWIFRETRLDLWKLFRQLRPSKYRKLRNEYVHRNNGHGYMVPKRSVSVTLKSQKIIVSGVFDVIRFFRVQHTNTLDLSSITI